MTAQALINASIRALGMLISKYFVVNELHGDTYNRTFDICQPCQNEVFLKFTRFHWTIHAVLYQALIPKAGSFQLYTTCHTPFHFIC